MAKIDVEQTQQQARELLDSRIESVTDLIKTRQRVTDLESDLAAARKEEKQAYVRATKDGWSADELKKLGLENNAATKRRSTTTRQKKNTARSSMPDANTEQSSTPADADPSMDERQ